MHARRLLAQLSPAFVAAALAFPLGAATHASAAPRSAHAETTQNPHQDNPSPNSWRAYVTSEYQRGYLAGYQAGFAEQSRRCHGSRSGPNTPGTPNYQDSYGHGYSDGYDKGRDAAIVFRQQVRLVCSPPQVLRPS